MAGLKEKSTYTTFGISSKYDKKGSARIFKTLFKLNKLLFFNISMKLLIFCCFYSVLTMLTVVLASIKKRPYPRYPSINLAKGHCWLFS